MTVLERRSVPETNGRKYFARLGRAAGMPNTPLIAADDLVQSFIETLTKNYKRCRATF